MSGISGLFLIGEIRNVLTKHNKERVDDVTGEVTKASITHKVQIEYVQAQPEGEDKIIIDDFNLKEKAQVEACLALKGKMVRLPVALWKIDGKAGLSIPAGNLPTALSPVAKAA